MTRFRIGVDAGGTSAEAVVVDSEDVPVGRGRAPGAVLSVGAVAPGVSAVAAASLAALADAGLAPPVAALWAGMAGAGRDETRIAARAALGALGIAERVGVGTDVDAAFESAFGTGPGLLLVAGTGSIALGRDGAGRSVRVGGWGALLGDEGSGYWIAMQALGCVARAADGRAQPTELEGALTERLGLSAPRELIGWVSGASKGEVAALAPVVLDLAASGDPVAASIATDAAAALRMHLVALVERMDSLPDPPPALALWGGLIREGGALRPVLERLLAPLGLERVDRPVDPPMGAARLARGLLTGAAD